MFMKANEVVGQIQDKKIRWVVLQFPDISGRIRNISVNAVQLTEDSFKRGYTVSASQIISGVPAKQDEVQLIPDPDTYSLVPWADGTARMLCYIKGMEEFDSRSICYGANQEAVSAMGSSSMFCGAAIDFTIIESMAVTSSDRGQGYALESQEATSFGQNYALSGSMNSYVATPYDRLESIRFQASELLEQMFNYTVEKHYHGETFGKNTLVLGFSNSHSEADALSTLKYLVKNIAVMGNKIATFMPRPVDGTHNRLRLSFSAQKGEKWLFDDKLDLVTYFVSGIAEHLPSIMAFANPSVNSYGHGPQQTLSLGKMDKRSNINIPTADKPQEARVELNIADSSANPHLAIASMIMAGVDGMKKKRTMITINKNGIKTVRHIKLPASLAESTEALESDHSYISGVISKNFVELYAGLKRAEISKVSSTITAAEHSLYMDI